MKIAIFGASGFAREVADICLDLGYKKIVFIDAFPANDEYFGFPLVDETKVESLSSQGYNFIIGVGENKLRKKIFNKFSGLKYVNLIHPSATFGYRQREEIDRKAGNIITAGVRITNNVQVGNFCIFNLNCTIGHDCIIEDFATLSPGANISGNVHLLEGCYIGTNASTIQGKSTDLKLIIGKHSIVGAGSVVTKNVADNVIVKGMPAK